MPNEIVRLIEEKLDLLKSQAESATVQRAVLLDTHIKDQLVAFQMSQFLFEKNIQPYINPEDDDPVRNIQFLQERLKQVEALIIFFGQVGVEWVRARLAEAIKIVVTGGYPIKAFFVYLAPPETQKDALNFEQPFLNLHLLGNRKGFNPDSLGPLFEELGKGDAG